jgi:hypothetical protein
MIAGVGCALSCDGNHPPDSDAPSADAWSGEQEDTLARQNATWDRQVRKADEQAERYDKLLDTWEVQASRMGELLNRWERLLISAEAKLDQE